MNQVNVKGETMAMPLGKRRALPDWMVGAGSRVGIGAKQSYSRQAAAAKQKATYAKAPPKPRGFCLELIHFLLHMVTACIYIIVTW
jgi:hypothetical protein